MSLWPCAVKASIRTVRIRTGTIAWPRSRATLGRKTVRNARTGDTHWPSVLFDAPVPDQTDAPLVLHARRDVNALSAAGCAVATLASLWMYRHGTASPLWNAALLLFVPTFAIATAALVRRVLDPRPALVVDERGIRDRRTGVDVAWHDVRRIHVWRQQLKTTHVDWIALDVADADAARPGVLNRNPTLKAVARAMGAPPVLLQTSDLTMPQDAVLAELQRRLAARTGAQKCEQAAPS